MKHVTAWIGCALVFVGACSSETPPTHDDAVKRVVDASTASDATTQTPDDVVVDAGAPVVPVIETGGSGGDSDTEKPAVPSVAGRGSATAGSGSEIQGTPTVMDAGVSDAGAAGGKAEAKAGTGGSAGHSGRGGAGGVGGAAGAAGHRAGAGGDWTQWLPWGDAGLPWSDGGLDSDWWNDLPFVPGGPTAPIAGVGGVPSGPGGAGGIGGAAGTPTRPGAAGAGGLAGAGGASATATDSQ